MPLPITNQLLYINRDIAEDLNPQLNINHVVVQNGMLYTHERFVLSKYEVIRGQERKSNLIL